MYEGWMSYDEGEMDDPEKQRKKDLVELKCWKKVREMVFKKYLKIAQKIQKEGDEELSAEEIAAIEKNDTDFLIGYKIIEKTDPDGEMDFKKFNIKLFQLHEEWIDS